MYGVIITSKVKSTRVGHIYSVVANKDLENGFVGIVGDLASGESEIRNFATPITADLTSKSLCVIATPELIYDQSTKAKQSLGNFINKQGVPAVALPLEAGDEVMVSDNLIDPINSGTGVVIGNYLVAQNNSNKLKEVASLAGTEKFAAKIEKKQASGIATFVGTSGMVGNVYNLVGYKVIQN